jgi:hypothetical protein
VALPCIERLIAIYQAQITRMLSAYFDLWARYWHDIGLTLETRSKPVQWIVEFGSIARPLEEIHPDTGLPRLVSPTKERLESALKGDFSELTVVLRIDPAKGVMHAFRGPQRIVREARDALKNSGENRSAAHTRLRGDAEP